MIKKFPDALSVHNSIEENKNYEFPSSVELYIIYFYIELLEKSEALTLNRQVT